MMTTEQPNQNENEQQGHPISEPLPDEDDRDRFGDKDPDDAVDADD